MFFIFKTNSAFVIVICFPCGILWQTCIQLRWLFWLLSLSLLFQKWPEVSLESKMELLIQRSIMIFLWWENCSYLRYLLLFCMKKCQAGIISYVFVFFSILLSFIAEKFRQSMPKKYAVRNRVTKQLLNSTIGILSYHIIIFE